MSRFLTRQTVILLSLVLAFVLPGLADDGCENETDLFIANLARSQTQLSLWVSNPTQELLYGELTITAEYDETGPVTFDWNFPVNANSTAIVEITFPSAYTVTEATLCEGGPGAINESPDPILVRVR